MIRPPFGIRQGSTSFCLLKHTVRAGVCHLREYSHISHRNNCNLSRYMEANDEVERLPSAKRSHYLPRNIAQWCIPCLGRSKGHPRLDYRHPEGHP
jgi:hypothetical protein